ncbi:MAG: hypothetical protein VST67_05300, partial [Nitrospirota bacterium]|nr:hypothetical protein [Nitrospirota bacterium]
RRLFAEAASFISPFPSLPLRHARHSSSGIYLRILGLPASSQQESIFVSDRRKERQLPAENIKWHHLPTAGRSANRADAQNNGRTLFEPCELVYPSIAYVSTIQCG